MKSAPFIAALLFVVCAAGGKSIAASDGAEKKAEARDKSEKPSAPARKRGQKQPEENSRGKSSSKAAPKPRARPDSDGSTKLLTATYEVAPGFFSQAVNSVAGEIFDPFATSGADGQGGVRSYPALEPKRTLEQIGLTFGEGASASYELQNFTLKVVNTREQLDMLELYMSLTDDQRERQMHIIVEFIEVEHAWFSDWLFENRLDTDGTPLRNEVQELVREGDATVLESMMVTARSGQRAKAESILEVIYPTEYDSPKIPEEVELSGRAEAPVTAVLPTAFETRNVGTTVEVDPVIGRDNATIDLNLAPEKVEHQGYSIWPNDEVEAKFKTMLPTFYTMRFSTQVTALDGRYVFLGTARPMEGSQRGVKDPLVLGFVRADIGVKPLK